MSLRTTQAENRMKFYEHSQLLIKTTANSFLNKYTFGSELANISSSYKEGLSSVCSSKINQLENIYRDYAIVLRDQEKKKFKEFPQTLKEIRKLIDEKPKAIFDLIRKHSLHLYLIESENPYINLNTVLYFISLKYLSSSFEELVFIASLIVQKGYLCDHSVSEIL